MWWSASNCHQGQPKDGSQVETAEPAARQDTRHSTHGEAAHHPDMFWVP